MCSHHGPLSRLAGAGCVRAKVRIVVRLGYFGGALVLTLALGCAQGSAGGGGGGDSGSGRRDSGPSSGRDVGTVPRDTGTPTTTDTGTPMPTCEDEGHGSSCELATDLGPVMTGDELLLDPGVLPNAGDEDWFRIDFPAMTEGMPGMGMPAIELAVNEGNGFRIEVRDTCSTTLGCPDGTSARDISSWSFVDDASMEGEMQFSTRDVPWPESVVVRIYRPDGVGDCQEYQLRISR
jgi:hypothetical protein